MLNLYAAAAACALLVGVGVAADRLTPYVGANAQLARAHAATAAETKRADGQTIVAAGWKASFEAAEALRKAEGGRAVDAVNDQAKACDARVARARTSAAAIQSIVTKETPHDQNGCPSRVLVDPRELRNALAPPG